MKKKEQMSPYYLNRSLIRQVTHILISFIIVTSFTACKKYLEVEPVNAVSDENPITDKISAETALNGTYRQLGNSSYYGENYVTLGYFPSGDVKNLTTGGAANLVNINFRADDPAFNSAWVAIYSTINRANNVIAKVPGANDPLLTNTLKEQYVAEAKFIRALAYFDLARAFGGVQLFLNPTSTLDDLPQLKRSSLSATYAQVLKDLTEAENALPNMVNRIRATRRTVWALKARLYLYTGEWALAEQYASQLISLSGDYQLLKPYSAWFANNVTGTQESIFEIQFSAQNPSTLRDQMGHPASKQSGTYRYAPTDKFVQLLKNKTIAGGRRALIDSVKQGGTTLWFGSLYYRNPSTDPSYVFRIAEMYLIRAEARAHLNDIQHAKDDLNLIRDRAGVVPSDAQTAADILLAIEEENRFEFAWEAHRWFDLARTGRAKQVLETISPTIHVDPWETVFPIPATQLQLDPNLEQNPGY
jgi:hypothetical protein